MLRQSQLARKLGRRNLQQKQQLRQLKQLQQQQQQQLLSAGPSLHSAVSPFRPLKSALQVRLVNTAAAYSRRSTSVALKISSSKVNNCRRAIISDISQRWLSTSSTTSEAEEHSFQAETRQLLDIVTNSLYTDKDVFLRELVSNASDALEKLRHMQAMGAPLSEPDIPLQISIRIDKEAKTLIITDTGVGLSKEEMVANLGTIARSGSKAFVSELGGGEGSAVSGDSTSDAEAASSIIGKFGVGFYSAFMVGNKVSVASRPATPGEAPFVWESEGSGSYSLSPFVEDMIPKEEAKDDEDAAAGAQAKDDGDADDDEEEEQDEELKYNDDGVLRRGSRITIHLKDDQLEFLEQARLKGIINKHSNFVNFPILLENEVVNTVQAIWTKAPSEVDDDGYKSFYQFLTAAFDEPKYRLHFRADAPIDLKVLLYVPSFHMEKFGGGRMDPGVSLYSRKVLIEKDSPDLLPEWMRFVKGVVRTASFVRFVRFSLMDLTFIIPMPALAPAANTGG